MRLTKEEKQILSSVERGEWRSVMTKQLLHKYQEAARNTLRKNARLNIRITSHDLQSLQKKAVNEGLPYQTFVSSILHKYVTGQLVES